MRTIHKHIISVDPYNGQEAEISTRVGDKLLKVMMIGDVLSAWVLTHTENEQSVRPFRFFIIGTGSELPKGDWIYVDSVRKHPYIWHILRK